MEAKYLENIVTQLHSGDSEAFGRLVFDGYKNELYDEFLIQRVRVANERKCSEHKKMAINIENLYIVSIVKDCKSISAFVKIRQGELDMCGTGMTIADGTQKRRVGDGYKKIFYGHSCWYYDFIYSPHNKLLGSR